MKKQLDAPLILVLLLICSHTLYSQLSLSALFSYNMVLQHKTNAPIWGE